MNAKYILIGQSPVPCDDPLEWAEWFETADRRVAATSCWLGLVWVSTVFLGLDHSFARARGEQDTPPLLFESMAFWGREGGWDCARCSTWQQAEAQHLAMVAETRRPRALLAWLVRQARATWRP